MTVVITTTEKQYTLWNVISFTVLPDRVAISHSDRKPTVIDEFVEKIVVS